MKINDSGHTFCRLTQNSLERTGLEAPVASNSKKDRLVQNDDSSGGGGLYLTSVRDRRGA